MRTFIYVIVAMVVGVFIGYLIFNKPTIHRNCKDVVKEEPIGFPLAMQYYCNYLSKADSICGSKSENTRYLNISSCRLKLLLTKFEKKYKNFGGIRIYPMIYPKDSESDFASLLNIMIIPLVDTVGDFKNEDLYEVYETDSLGNKFVDAISGIHNQLGQCPPQTGQCITDGADLLRETWRAMKQSQSNQGISQLKPNSD